MGERGRKVLDTVMGGRNGFSWFGWEESLVV